MVAPIRFTARERDATVDAATVTFNDLALQPVRNVPSVHNRRAISRARYQNVSVKVETKKAPDQLIASRLREGKVDRTRPICPYPQVAAYKGGGSTDDAANFECKAQ